MPSSLILNTLVTQNRADFIGPVYFDNDISFPNVQGVMRVYNVKDYGAVGDGVTNDVVAIQAAHDAIVSSGHSGTLFIPTGTYKVNSGLTIDVSFVAVLGAQAVLDFSSQTSGSALTFYGDSNNTYAGNPYYNADKYISNLTFIGNSSGGNVKCFRFYTAAEPGPSHFKVYNCNISNFGRGISIEDNSYLISIYGTDIWLCGSCLVVPTATNAGERILVSGCALFNSDRGVVIDNSNADVMIDGCSIDGMHVSYFEMTAGYLSITNCHMEGTFNPDYPNARVLYVPASSTDLYANFNTCIFIIKGSRNNPAFDIQDTCYLSVNDCEIILNTTATVDIIKNTGTGGEIDITGTTFNASDVNLNTTSNYWYNAKNAQTITTNKNLTVSGVLSAKGQTGSTSVAAGYIGEVISSTGTNVTHPTSGQWGDVTSISLTAGHWMISGLVVFSAATGTTECFMGISTTTGNSSTGLVSGDTQAESALPTSSFNTSASIPFVEAKLSGTTTYYLKHRVDRSGAAGTDSGRITAMRVS